MIMAVKLTKREVDAAQPGEKDVFLFDEDLIGFGLKITPTGRKVYLAQYRIRGTKKRVMIGVHGSPWTPEKAREEAKRLLGLVFAGQDPAEQKAEAKAVPTLAEAAKRFHAEYVIPQTKPRTAIEYWKQIDKIVIPRLGGIRLDAVQRSHIVKLHQELRETPYQANRTLSVLSKMFNWFELIGLRPERTNPTLHVKKYREEKRERLLNDEELARLGRAILEAEQAGASPYIVAAIRLLILTGARLNEILTIKWDEVDFQYGALRLEDSKTGAKSITLNPPALELLARIPRMEGNPHVICGKLEGQSMVNINRVWRSVRTNAGLESLRIHDLRHAFASVGASMGMSLPVIGKLLGHTQSATTARYAHLANDPLKKATGLIGARIANALEGWTESDNVVPLTRQTSGG
ncbi:MAG: tyrosine-type recombinase/integrase [Magnetococcales bacterium]|nr:tyrosine-type recombinase/integrase [Magnetococcales bacterium]